MALPHMTLWVRWAKKISPSVFSRKKEYIKKLRCNSTVKIWFGRKKLLDYAYVLKNGVGRYNIFFLFLHKSCWILLCRFRVESVNIFIYNMCFYQQAISHMRKRFPEWVQSGRMNIAWVNIGFYTGFKKIKQRRISFVLGYLRMTLWKISTAISIKHRILATFNIKKKFNSDSLYAFNVKVVLHAI